MDLVQNNQTIGNNICVRPFLGPYKTVTNTKELNEESVKPHRCDYCKRGTEVNPKGCCCNL